MKFNPPRAVRAVLYLSAMFATPTVSYLAATDRISDSLTVLLTAYIALVMGLAVANTATSEPTPPRVSGVDGDDWTGGAAVSRSTADWSKFGPSLGPKWGEHPDAPEPPA